MSSLYAVANARVLLPPDAAVQDSDSLQWCLHLHQVSVADSKAEASGVKFCTSFSRRSPRSGDGATEEGAGPGPSARRSVSQETSASGWSTWSTEDSEGESSARKRRRFELLRREHYNMRQALAKCAARSLHTLPIFCDSFRAVAMLAESGRHCKMRQTLGKCASRLPYSFSTPRISLRAAIVLVERRSTMTCARRLQSAPSLRHEQPCSVTIHGLPWRLRSGAST